MTARPVTLPESFAILRVLVVLLVLLASVKEGILSVSSCWKDTPV